MKLPVKNVILLFITCFSFSFVSAQKQLNIEIDYSFGFVKSKVLDEWDNAMIYDGSKFQPFNLNFKFESQRWMHRVNFYYTKNKLNAFTGEDLFSYNYVNNESDELSYDVLYKFYLSENKMFYMFGGVGIHAFGSFRHRETLSKNYPFEDIADSYDVNSGSFQIVLSPNYQIKQHFFCLTFSTGVLNYVTRPDSYNSRYSSNHGKWYYDSYNKHFNLLSVFEYKRNISKNFLISTKYRFLYYSYSFPYKLKVLNQNYLLGLVYKL